MKLHWKIFLASLLIAAGAVTAGSVYVDSVLRRSITDEVRDSLRSRLELLTTLLEERTADGEKEVNLQRWVHSSSGGAPGRLTIIGPGGDVLADSSVVRGDLPEITPDLNRPEIAAALSGETGLAERYSDSQGTTLLIGARRFRFGDGWGVVRVVQPLASVDAAAARANDALRAAAFLALALASILGWIVSRWVSAPIRELTEAARRVASGDYTVRADVRGGKEVGELARTFNEMTRQIDASERVYRDFVANVSHELRTPLTSISAYAETLVTELPPEAPHGRFAAALQRSAKKLDALLRRLLDLSRLERPGFVPELEEGDLVQLLRECTEEFEPRLAAKRVSLELALSDASIPLRFDPALLGQVAANLLDNALRYTPEGGRIRVRGGTAGGDVFFEIRDGGPGISPGDLQRIFERFYRADKGRGGQSAGTGLGLAVVKHIVERHDGTVEAENDPAGGACFRVTLPRS